MAEPASWLTAQNAERRSDQRQRVPRFQRLRATVSSQSHLSLSHDPATDLFVALLWPSAPCPAFHFFAEAPFPPGPPHKPWRLAPLTNIATGLIFASQQRCRLDPSGQRAQTGQPECQTALTLSWPGFSRSKALALPTLQSRSNLVHILVSSRRRETLPRLLDRKRTGKALA
jgi:hypothetical protein